MGVGRTEERAYVIYRGTGRGGRPVEVHLVARPGVATVADAWARLTRLDPTVEPTSLEIETRRLPRPSGIGKPRPGPRRPEPPVDLARWLAARARMAQHGRP
jgi:hypothetical protein